MARATPLAVGALLLGVLAGCPQLLDDGFAVPPPLPVGPDGNQEPYRPETDAGGSCSSACARDAGGLDRGDALAELGPLVAHRYDFDGNGNTVLDSVGTAHGTSIGASLDGSGKLYLSGDDQYVNLPSGLISGFRSVSIECWVNWAGSGGSRWREESAATWQNLFTFGTSDQGTGRQGSGTRYIYLTPQPASYYGSTVRAGYSLTGFNTESYVSGDQPFPVSSDTNRGTQVVYALDAAQNRLSVFVDGKLVVAAPSSQQIDLSAIPDVNNWLGRSQFLDAAAFEGELLDVRIYRVALSTAQVELSFDLGPDAEL